MTLDFNNISKPGTLTDASGVFSSVTITNKQSAGNAVFDFNSTTVTRQSNAVSDLVSGLTFTIKQPTPAFTLPATGLKIDVIIQPDQSIIKSNIRQWMQCSKNKRSKSIYSTNNSI